MAECLLLMRRFANLLVAFPPSLWLPLRLTSWSLRLLLRPLSRRLSLGCIPRRLRPRRLRHCLGPSSSHERSPKAGSRCVLLRVLLCFVSVQSASKWLLAWDRCVVLGAVNTVALKSLSVPPSSAPFPRNRLHSRPLYLSSSRSLDLFFLTSLPICGSLRLSTSGSLGFFTCGPLL